MELHVMSSLWHITDTIGVNRHINIPMFPKTDENWKLSNEIDWQEGTPGKGIIVSYDGIGEVDTWTTDGEGRPVHTEYCGTHGIDWENVVAAFDIAPDGGIWSFLKDDVGPEAREIIQEADPRLNASEASPDLWHFGADTGDVLDWEEGQEGKGIIDRNGHVYTWDADEYVVHQQWLQDHPEIMPMKYFDIAPDGKCEESGLGDNLTEMDEEVLREADSRLYVEQELAPTWNLAL
jgi:hypothetical protein